MYSPEEVKIPSWKHLTGNLHEYLFPQTTCTCLFFLQQDKKIWMPGLSATKVSNRNEA